MLRLTQPWSATGVFGLDIEVPEAALFGDTLADVKKLRLLRTAGVRVAVDDFGSGQSSLARFTDLPIDTLKIDPMLVRRLTIDRASRTLVSTIISMAHGLSLTVTAEGVEDAGAARNAAPAWLRPRPGISAQHGGDGG